MHDCARQLYVNRGNAKTRADAEHRQRQDPTLLPSLCRKAAQYTSICSTDSPHMTLSTLSHFTSGSGTSGNRKGWDTERHGAQ